MMNLAHWRLLVAIADIGNISRAAERVGITQSGASQAVQESEYSGQRWRGTEGLARFHR